MSIMRPTPPQKETNLAKKTHPLTLSPFHLVIFCLLLLTSACQSRLLTPPRLATETAVAQTPPTVTPEPVFLPAPTPTPGAVATTAVPPEPESANPSLTIWINETDPTNEQILQELMTEFETSAQVDVELALVPPMLLPELITTAVLSDTLPDIVFHPLIYTAGWVQRGILIPAVADEIVAGLGPETFNGNVLELLRQGRLVTAVPSDGYPQIILYRQDWFDERGLAPPDNFDAMLAAAETLFAPEDFISGFVAPTESNLITTHQVFEQMAAANGCQLIDEAGEVQLLQPACQEAIDFYFALINQFSPIGVQTDASARSAYLAGRTGMIVTSSAILPALAGLDKTAVPTCPACTTPDYLAQNSGIITQITGSGPLAKPANFGTITNLGITRQAERETAVAFARFWFNEGYGRWLAVSPEQKVPMRWGTTAQPHLFIDNWGGTPLTEGQPSLADLWGTAVTADIAADIASPTRWAIPQKQGGLLIAMYEELVLPIVLQEMLSGYFGPEQTLLEMYNRVIELIPNYAFPVETNQGSDS